MNLNQIWHSCVVQQKDSNKYLTGLMRSDVIDLVVKVLMLSRSHLGDHANVSICQNKIPL